MRYLGSELDKYTASILDSTKCTTHNTRSNYTSLKKITYSTWQRPKNSIFYSLIFVFDVRPLLPRIILKDTARK